MRVDIYEIKQKILFPDVDSSVRVTPFALFNYFQDAAEHHAEQIGVGRNVMLGAKHLWVLSRMSVVINARPKLDDEVLIRSWPRGYDRLFCVRDYDIADASGNTIVRARSGWLVVDYDKRRPLRPETLGYHIPKNEGLDAISGTPFSLEKRNNLIKIGERRAAYSDIDSNSHVNNARYVQWVQDLSDGEQLKNANQIRIDINYVNETYLNDIVELWSVSIDDDKYGGDDDMLQGANYKIACEGRKHGGTDAVFRAELRVIS
jgi:acyl-ACP thioesterase